jgi:hypothetical protein
MNEPEMSEEDRLNRRKVTADTNATDERVEVISTPASDAPTDVNALIQSAHEVLVHYLPGRSLPSELSKVRALLDAHMFGRDNRTQRDDVVRVARQIDTYKNKKTARSR